MKQPTRLIHNRAGGKERRTVNPPIEHASTVLLPDRKALYHDQPGYGRMGLSVHRELEAALCDMEKARFARLTPSGLSACAVAIAAAVKAGDTILISDSVYGPTRRFCERRLERMGVTSKRFDPRDPEALSALIDASTTAIYLEAPGSLTFEISDTPAIVDIARRHGIKTIMDNTWAAGIFQQPLVLGIDISVQALTKYVVGHSDAFAGGIMTVDQRIATEVENVTEDWGISLAPDDAYAALRGTRTLVTRLRQHEQSALKIAEWLESQPSVRSVIHPALRSHPDHAIWKRDFSGSAGLFAFVLDAQTNEETDAFLDSLELFKMGFSWGGFESLIIPCDEQLTRLKGDWTDQRGGHLMRLQVGLEDVDDLLADLECGLAALRREKKLD